MAGNFLEIVGFSITVSGNGTSYSYGGHVGCLEIELRKEVDYPLLACLNGIKVMGLHGGNFAEAGGLGEKAQGRLGKS